MKNSGRKTEYRRSDELSGRIGSAYRRLEKKVGKGRLRFIIADILLVIVLIFVIAIPGSDGEPSRIISSPEPEGRSILSPSGNSSAPDGDSSSPGWNSFSPNGDSSAPDESSKETETTAPEPEVSEAESSSVAETAESSPEGENLGSLAPLKSEMEERFKGFNGEWSAYVKNLNTGEWFTVNEHQVYPASMIKLFALAACYQKIEDGELDEGKYYPTMFNMAAVSNNQAFNIMVWAIGKTYITDWCHSHGYTRTGQYHGLEPSTNAEGLTTSDKKNETCASDAGRILESMYRGECVSKEASEKMINILLQQKWKGKIPYGLPNGTKVANKTGDTYNVSHDAAIVWSDGADYVLVLMCEVPDIAFNMHYRFIETSKLVYEYFNPTEKQEG